MQTVLWFYIVMCVVGSVEGPPSSCVWWPFLDFTEMAVQGGFGEKVSYQCGVSFSDVVCDRCTFKCVLVSVRVSILFQPDGQTAIDTLHDSLDGIPESKGVGSRGLHMDVPKCGTKVAPACVEIGVALGTLKSRDKACFPTMFAGGVGHGACVAVPL